MYYVYVLWSEKVKMRYVGSTEAIDARLKQHNSGHARFTRRGIPWILLGTEEYPTKTEAIKREHFLKSGAGRALLDQLFPKYHR